VGLLTDSTDNGQKRVKRLEKAVGLEPFEDAQEASRDLSPPTPLTQQQLAICNRTFSEFDADGSGTMDLEELGSAMRRLGHDLPEAILQDMIDEIDSDGDGTIDFQEFCSLAANANGGVERALENMSLVARQKAVQQSMQEHAAELRGAVRDIQDLKAGMTEQRVKVLEGQHMETCAEVERVRQGLELTQEYWKGLSNGLREAKRAVPSQMDTPGAARTLDLGEVTGPRVPQAPVTPRDPQKARPTHWRNALPAISAGRACSSPSPTPSEASTIASPRYIAHCAMLRGNKCKGDN
jgi:hypothetical protein